MRLEVVAIPMYFASMGAEYVVQKHRAERDGPTPGTYERSDTLTSLTMGTASLVVPLVAPKLLRPITPGVGRYGKALVGGAVAAAAATTVADLLARRLEATGAGEDDAPGPSASPAPTGEDGAAASGPTAGAHAGAPATGSARNRSRRRSLARIARKVARYGGVAAVAAGGVAVTTALGHATRASALWRRRILPDLGTGPLAWAVAIVGWDLLYYWNHRIWHETRFMWANHVMHHSSEHYNLSTALRQAVTDPFLALVPYGSLALLGVRPEIIMQSRAINLLYQYWIHTEVIDRLGPAEAVLNSPSHHRAHHGSNPQYIDRNHGGILIAWDRLFGTFEPEDEPVVYGLTKNIDTFNPLRVATHEYADMFRDVADADTWHDRLANVLRGPGWAYDWRAAREAAARGAAAGEPDALEAAAVPLTA